MLQRIQRIGPALNIGRDIDEDMIPGDEYLVGRLIQTGVAHGMAGGGDTFQSVIADLDGVEMTRFEIYRETLAAALDDVDTAYYLVHSMGSDRGFEEMDRRGAANFAAAR